MSARATLIRWLGGTPEAAKPGPAAGAVREAAGVTIDADEQEWRPLGTGSRRDLSPLTQSEMQRRAAALWETNLLARQLVELPIAYLLAEGVRITVPNADAQAWLDAWWNDPITDMPLRLPELMRDPALTGEAACPIFTNPISGHVRLGYLDPSLIETVILDPENASRPIGIVTRRDRKGRQRRYRIAFGAPETVLGETAQAIRETLTDGDIHYFRANALAGGRRGRSDLLAAIDWLESYESYLYGEVDRAGHLRAHVWDVTLAGADEEAVAKRAAEISAAEMGDPGFKTLAMRQRLWTQILRRAAAHAIRSRLDPAGKSMFDLDNPDPDLAPSVEWPEMVVRDASRHAAALAQTTGAVAVALDRGLLSEATALRLLRALAERLGVEFDVDQELEAARAETAARAEADSFPTPPEDDEEEDTG